MLVKGMLTVLVPVAIAVEIGDDEPVDETE